MQIITWNGTCSKEWGASDIDPALPDYGESHYIGPIAGAQPNSQAWVNGFDHQGKPDIDLALSGAALLTYTTIQAGST